MTEIYSLIEDSIEKANNIIIRRKHLAEAAGNIITRSVHVDRSRAFQEVIDATGRIQHVDRNIIEMIPQAEGDDVDIFFLKFSHRMNDKLLEEEHERHKFISADPYSLATFNEADPSFADECSNITHWEKNGEWFCIIFMMLNCKRVVGIVRSRGEWYDDCWFACRRPYR